jgi:hypothetical protein
MSGRDSVTSTMIQDVQRLVWRRTYETRNYNNMTHKSLQHVIRLYHLLRQCIHHMGRQKHGVQPLALPVGKHLRTRRIFALLTAQPKHGSIS